MKKYLSLLLLGSLVLGAAMPAYAEIQSESTSGRLVAQSDAQVATAEDLISLLAAGEFEDAVKKYDFNQDVTAESLETDWDDLIEENGAFQQQVEVVASRENIVVIRCEFADKTIDLIVVLNDRNQVISLNKPQS
jgi:hypothetical protein